MDDKPQTIRVGVTPADHTTAEKLRAAIERAGFKQGDDEGQIERVLDTLLGALRLYLATIGRDPDNPSPEEERRQLEEQIRKARRENPQFKYADLEPVPIVPTIGKRLTGFIKALKAAREQWRALSEEPEIQTALGLPRYEIRKHADSGAEEYIDVDPLQAIIERAERIKKERIGGRPKNEALNGLLKSIVWEWWCVFVENPRDSPRAGITYSGNAVNDADRYGGDLLKFTCDVLKSHDIPYTRSALGRRLHVFATQTWLMSRHENPPAKTN